MLSRCTCDHKNSIHDVIVVLNKPRLMMLYLWECEAAVDLHTVYQQ
jgi:hypothetical protein